jgi:hypothetical protein
VALAALVIGVLITAQGVLGLAVPEMFVGMVRRFQTPPVIYAAAILRALFGLILVLAAPTSRAPKSLRILGVLILIGGLLTPFIGARFGQLVLGWWWEGGAGVVRGWAGVALALGAFIVYATAPSRRAA